MQRSRRLNHRQAGEGRRLAAFGAGLIVLASVGVTRGESLRLVFTGHIHPLVQVDRLFELADLIAAERPDRVVIGGDVILGPDRLATYQPAAIEEQWAKFELFVERVGRPVHLVPGNHDVSSSFPSLRGEVWRAYPERWAVPGLIDVGNIRLVFLGTVDRRTGNLGLRDEDLAFLSDALAGAGDRRVLIFVHHWLWESPEWWSRVRSVLGGDTERWVFAGDHSHTAASVDGNLHLYGCGCGADALNYLVIDVSDESIVVTAGGTATPVLQPIAMEPPAFRTWIVSICRHNLKLFAMIVACAGMLCGVVIGFALAHRRRGGVAVSPATVGMPPASGWVQP